MQWYTFGVPTTKARYQITETDEISAALDAAAERWPDEPRSELARKLIIEGARFLEFSRVERALEIELALSELAALGDAYPPGYLEKLRRDWPE
jgi:hypothetical protein